MSIPIRCYTCGKVIANKWEKFITYTDKEQAFKDLKIERYCCKRMLLTNIDTESILSPYEHLPDNISLKTERCDNIIHNGR
jgi:DNA-directed RNA polymerase subunit N (RpoN/RPB10)